MSALLSLPARAWAAGVLLGGLALTWPGQVLAADAPAAVSPGAGAGLRANQCLIEPLQRIELRSAVAAPIVAVHVDRGATVRKGQLLVSLDAAVEQAALQVAEFRSVMEGATMSAASRLKNASERLQRRDELLQQNFISAQDRDDAAAEARIAEADLTQARDDRQLARLEAQQLKASVARFSIFSPVNGVVTERLQNPGEMPQTGENAPAILKLAQIDPLRVDIVLPVAHYGRVKAGGQVTVQPEAPFTGVYRATVKAVDKVVDSASGTFRVRLELPNPRGQLPVGVRCTATL